MCFYLIHVVVNGHGLKSFSIELARSRRINTLAPHFSCSNTSEMREYLNLKDLGIIGFYKTKKGIPQRLAEMAGLLLLDGGKTNHSVEREVKPSVQERPLSHEPRSFFAQYSSRTLGRWTVT